MKRWKSTIVLAAGAVMLSGSMNVSAAGLRDVFDAEYYAENYSDLREAFGNDANALYQHYMTYGLNEKRSASKVFDVIEYRNAYPDLDAAFGDDWDAYVEHYCTYGIAEGRTAGVYGEIMPSMTQDDENAVETEENENTDETETNDDAGEDAAENTEIWVERNQSIELPYNIGEIWGTVTINIDEDHGYGYSGFMEFTFDNMPFDYLTYNDGDDVDDVYYTYVDRVWEECGYFIHIEEGCYENLDWYYDEEGYWRGWQFDFIYNGVKYPTIVECYRVPSYSVVVNYEWDGENEIYTPDSKYGYSTLINMNLGWSDAPEEVVWQYVDLGLIAFGTRIYLK